jgi:hypothetical protein
MKKIKNILLIGIAILFNSCSKEKREEQMTTDLSREWKVVKYELNGFDETSTFDALYPNYWIDFRSEGTYTEYYLVFGITVPVNGNWEFQNDLEDAQLTDPDRTRLYHIIELSDDKLTVEDTYTAEDDVFYLEPK